MTRGNVDTLWKEMGDLVTQVMKKSEVLKDFFFPSVFTGHEVQQGQDQVLHLGQGNPKHKDRLGGERAALRRRSWGCWLMRSSM